MTCTPKVGDIIEYITGYGDIRYGTVDTLVSINNNIDRVYCRDWTHTHPNSEGWIKRKKDICGCYLPYDKFDILKVKIFIGVNPTIFQDFAPWCEDTQLSSMIQNLGALQLR